jgi:Flp pilus assembly protein TadG
MAFHNSMRRLWQDRRGNFAMMMGILALPALGAVGLAVDFTNLSRMKSQLQNANDAAVLFASRYHEVNRKLPPKENVVTFLNTNFGPGILDAQLYIADGNIWLDSQSQHAPYIMQVFSHNVGNVSVRSAAPVGEAIDLEIVLALDTTGSMAADGKMDGLKTAASGFVTTVLAASNDENRVRIGLVPFGRYVNVGLHNRNASWMDVPEDSSVRGEEKCEMRRKVIGQTNCRTKTGYNDGVPYQYKQCDNIYGDYQEVCWTPKSSAVWKGCVGSRQDPLSKQPLNLVDSYPNIPFPGIMNVTCQTPIAPLTANKKSLLAQIAAFKPTGETYIVDGVMWGLRVLSPQLPFTEAADPKKVSREIRKIMVLMTDGENTVSADLPKAPTHKGNDKNLSDNWTGKACREAEKNRVEIFTITFGKDVPAYAKKIMQECAASKDHYFDAANASKLDEAFRAIAATLTRVRLTH